MHIEIAYNAKGQRILTIYGNKVMTRHVYDKSTFRLVRMRTEQCVTVQPFTYLTSGSWCCYIYDNLS
jgi:hypothetical protein